MKNYLKQDIGNFVESPVEEGGQMGKGGRLIQIREHIEPCEAKIMMNDPGVQDLNLCPKKGMMKLILIVS